VALWETMTVGENVAMGPECRLAGESPIRQLFGRQRDRLACNTVAEEALSQCGILDLMETVVSELSTGQRRLVELARAISSRFSYLLLDEPSSGLDELETEQFGNVLRDVRSQGIGILLVEHDMTLVRQVCEFVYILDFGCLILEGPTAEVLSSEIVRAAYLGTELVEEHA
jgi:ABC-type branched-subunit amino acid transport system ATPase component